MESTWPADVGTASKAQSPSAHGLQAGWSLPVVPGQLCPSRWPLRAGCGSAASDSSHPLRAAWKLSKMVVSQTAWKNKKTWHSWTVASPLSRGSWGGVDAVHCAMTASCISGDGRFRPEFLHCFTLKKPHGFFLKKAYIQIIMESLATTGQNFVYCFVYLCIAPLPCSLAFCAFGRGHGCVWLPQTVSQITVSYGSPVAPGLQENKSRLQYWENDVCPHLYLTKSDLILHLFAART